MIRIVPLLRMGTIASLSLLLYLFAGTEARAAAPEVKSFIIPASHRTLTVPVIRFTATDDVAVTGYLITESASVPLVGDAGWTVTPPAAYTFGGAGSYTLYAWVKDVDGNISTSVSASTVVGSGEALIKASIAGCGNHTVALKSDGTIAAWGWNQYGQASAPVGLTNVTAIAAGENHTAVLKSDGTVTAWGRNIYGLTSVPALTNVAAIAAGQYHIAALKSDGTVVAWGNNLSGQTTIPSGLSNVVAIAAGYNHTAALKSDGTVTAWGDNTYGQRTIPAGLSGVVAIAAGSVSTAALLSDGTVTVWGDNGSGQTTVPVGLANVTAIAAGQNHLVALKSDGTVTAWGYNGWGQTMIPAGLTNVVAIAAGDNHTAALKSDGTIVAWGMNSYGQAAIPGDLSNTVAMAAGYQDIIALKSDGTVTAWGDNTFGQRTVPAGLSGVAAMAAGNYFTVALKSDGTVTAWGNNNSGQTTIPGGLSNVVAIAAGAAHTVALLSGGTVAAWGNNNSGQIDIPGGLSSVVAIAAGGSHTVALKSDGTVAAWGYDGYGQTDIPGGLTNVVAIAAGYNHTVALKSDGTITAWGDNSNGQTTIPAGLTGVVAIAATNYITEALKSDGTIAAWGYYGYGESFPPVVGPDTTAPVLFRFAPAPRSWASQVPILAMNASDDTGVAGYLITESSTPPSAGDGGWSATPPAFYTVGADGAHTLYAWTKDASNNISSPAIAAVVVDSSGPGTPGTPTDAGAYSASSSVVFTWTAATDADSGISGYNLQVGTTAGGSDIYNGAVGDVLTKTVTCLSGFSCYARVQVVNGVGTAGSWSGNSDGIQVDVTAPTVAITAPMNGSSPSLVSALSGTASDAASGINRVEIKVFDGTRYLTQAQEFTTALTWITASGTTSWTFDTSSVAWSTNTVYAMTARAVDNLGNVSNEVTVTFTKISLTTDTTPDAFTFIDETDVLPNTAITSNPITVTGINSSANISVIGGKYSVNNGPFVSTAGKVSDHATVVVKVTSSTAFSTAKSATLIIGGASDAFTVTTGVKDTVPDDTIAFGEKTDVTLNSLVISDAVTVTGINGAAAISITGGKYSVNNGSFVGTAGTVPPNAAVRVRVTASRSYGTEVTAVITLGTGTTVTGTFTATTKNINPSEVAEAVDNPTDRDLTTALTFTTNGWFGQDATALNGPDAAESGPIGNNQNSWLQTTVTGPCSVSFFQKVSSEASYDTLKFSIDGAVKSTISGEVNWQQKIFPITTAGPHVLRWTYAKNAGVIKGQDAAWVDSIVVSPNSALRVTSPNGGELLASGGTYTITWNAPAGVEKFKLFYSIDNGLTWKAIWADYVTGESYLWAVPVQGVNRTACKVKVVGYNGANAAAAADLSNAPFIISVLHISSPNGGETLISGASTTIDYTLNSTVSPVGSILFYSSFDNGATWQFIDSIVTGFALGPNSHDWTPQVTASKTSCKVKAVLKSEGGTTLGTDVSDHVFRITL